MRPRPLAIVPLLMLLALGLALAGCGNTLQTKPIPHNVLEGLIVSPFPVYWLGGSFEHLQITEATHDASGAYTVQYGNCLQGGQGECTPPLRVITSPDNSFLPGGDGASTSTQVRGLPALLTEDGRTISIPTAGVVVDIYASTPALANAAAQVMVPINFPGSPEEPLPARLPDTGFGSTPLPSQLPATVRPLS